MGRTDSTREQPLQCAVVRGVFFIAVISAVATSYNVAPAQSTVTTCAAQADLAGLPTVARQETDRRAEVVGLPTVARQKTDRRAEVGDADLYCIDLLPAKDIEHASGIARLIPPSSPFGVAVSRAGEMQYDIDFTLRDLPAASSLGAFTTYVAWATTPQLQPMIRLGEVATGSVRRGRVPFDRFLVLITAEASAASSAPVGRLVLRGTSASVRMQPHDLAFLLAGLLDSREAKVQEHQHDTHNTPAGNEIGRAHV